MSGVSGIALGEERLGRLIEVGRSIVADLDRELVLERVLEAARDLTGARYAALGILNPERTELEQFITLGIDKETHAAIGALPRGRGVLGLLIAEPKPMRLADVRQHPRSYGFPPGHPQMGSFLGLPILIRGEAFGNLYLTEKHGGEQFTEADEQAGMVLAEWAAIAIGNARLYESAERQRGELERAVQRLEAMTEITRVVGGEIDLDRVLSTVVERGRALVFAKWLAILLPEEDDLVVSAIAGEQSTERRGMRIPVEGSLPGAVFQALEAARHAGLSERKKSRGDVWFEAESELLVPMGFRGEGVGVLCAGDPIGNRSEFTADDERLLAAFAASAATAVATARSVAQDRLRQSISAAERERGRWARELHDETLQGLAALRMLLASGLRGGSPQTLEHAVTEATLQLDTEIQNLRALIAELRPAALDEIGVEAAIQALAEHTSATAGLAMETELSLSDLKGRDGGPGSELDSTIYRLVQEALTNVAKHSRAEHVRLSVVERNGAIEVTVSDDGVGFDPSAPHGGFGLLGMRERVAMVGGIFEVTSAPGAGATMRAVIPNG